MILDPLLKSRRFLDGLVKIAEGEGWQVGIHKITFILFLLFGLVFEMKSLVGTFLKRFLTLVATLSTKDD